MQCTYWTCSKLYISLTCSPEYCSFAIQSSKPFYPDPECMRHASYSGARKTSVSQVSVTQGLYFTCIHCSSNFATRRAADCHRRSPSSKGTPCADPRSLKSQSITSRPDLSTGILRQHDTVPLGECQESVAHMALVRERLNTSWK
jgi:hypothetical protein